LPNAVLGAVGLYLFRGAAQEKRFLWFFRLVGA